MEIVLPVRKGGLGNQMFQVAAALIYGKETGKRVILPREQKHIHKVHPSLYEESIFQGFDTLPTEVDSIAIDRLCQNGFTLYPGEPGFEKWEIYPIDGPLLLHGYFQYFPLIEKHNEDLCKRFLTGLEMYRKEGNPTQIGIHIRRGDYLKFTDVFTILDSSYYEKAIKEIEKRVPEKKLYRIFSEDLEWCRQQTVFQNLENLEFVEEKDEIKALCEMISCEGGFITANSSFSWWGAYLGAHQKGAPCITPKKWMKGFTGDLLPSSWIQI